MSSPQEVDTTKVAPPEEATTHIVDTITRPQEIHERPLSSSSLDSTNDDIEKRPLPDDDMSRAQQMQSTTESIYPPKAQRIAVMISLMLAMFLVALVRCEAPRSMASDH